MKKTAIFKAIPSIESVENKMPPKKRHPPGAGIWFVHVVAAGYNLTPQAVPSPGLR